jgi:RNA polymerase sigma-70 factor (ECF subfamily)
MSRRLESRLIRKARRGSSDALNAVFESYGERLLALIRLRLGPSLRTKLESRDLMQQTLIKAFQHIDQFEGSGERSLMGWLGAIACNEIRNQARYFRSDGRDARQEGPIEEAASLHARQLRTEVSRIHLREQTRRLEQAMERLAESHREVLLLRRFEELTFPQIGELLGKSPDACRMLYARALAALTLEMQEQEPSS